MLSRHFVGLTAACFVTAVGVGVFAERGMVARAASVIVDPSSAQQGETIGISGDVSRPAGATLCSEVALSSAAFQGIGAPDTPMTVYAPVDADRKFTIEVTLTRTVATGSYIVTARCAGADVSTTALQVTPLLPVSESVYGGEQLLALAVLIIAVSLVASARVWISKKAPKYATLVQDVFKKLPSKVTRAELNALKRNTSPTPDEAALQHYLRSHGRNVFIGKDFRVSTSKTLAIVWAIVLAYILLVLTLIAIVDGRPGLASDLIEPTSYVYLVLLGGPFAAAVGAKVVVSNRIANDTLQKTDASSTSPADLFTDDNGNTDLVDSQYTLFNLVALVVVLAQFVSRPGFGAPEIPGFLAALTGAAAATYLGNKAATSNAPSIEMVIPSSARIGQTVTAHGVNLHAAASADAKTIVTVAGNEVPEAVLAQADRVTFKVPPPPTAYKDEPVEVVIKTVAGATAVKPRALTIVDDTPELTGIDPGTVQPGAPFKVLGLRLFAIEQLNADGLAKGGATGPTVTLAHAAGGSVPCEYTQSAGDRDDRATFKVPTGTTPGTYRVDLHRGGRQAATPTPPLTLVVQ